jgi:hypothetical protein
MSGFRRPSDIPAVLPRVGGFSMGTLWDPESWDVTLVFTDAALRRLATGMLAVDGEWVDSAYIATGRGIVSVRIRFERGGWSNSGDGAARFDEASPTGTRRQGVTCACPAG